MRALKTLKLRDSYFELVRAFPLRAIRTEVEADAAGNALTRLLMSKPEEKMDSGELEYIQALSILIRDYESKANFDALPQSTPLSLLKHLMGEINMTGADLGRVIGSQSTASEILSGKRSMSKTVIAKLAKHFDLSPALFLPKA